jgi:hypothetical protein
VEELCHHDVIIRLDRSSAGCQWISEACLAIFVHISKRGWDPAESRHSVGSEMSADIKQSKKVKDLLALFPLLSANYVRIPNTNEAGCTIPNASFKAHASSYASVLFNLFELPANQ